MSDNPDHIKDLIPDPLNARVHNERNVGMIVSALHEVGAGRSIVIDEDDTILCGNATIEAAAIAGIEKVRVIETDGNEIIAVKRRDLTPEQKARLALFDNRAGDLATGYDPKVLEALVGEGVSLQGIFSSSELSGMLESLRVPEFEPATIDEQSRLDEKAKCTCPQCGCEFAP